MTSGIAVRTPWRLGAWLWLVTMLVLSPVRAEDSSFKNGAREAGRATGSAVREVGQGAKQVGKEIGQGVREAGREFRRAVKGEKR